MRTQAVDHRGKISILEKNKLLISADDLKHFKAMLAAKQCDNCLYSRNGGHKMADLEVYKCYSLCSLTKEYSNVVWNGSFTGSSFEGKIH